LRISSHLDEKTQNKNHSLFNFYLKFLIILVYFSHLFWQVGFFDSLNCILDFPQAPHKGKISFAYR